MVVTPPTCCSSGLRDKIFTVFEQRGRFLKKCTILAISLVLFGCASSEVDVPPPSQVLEPIPDQETPIEAPVHPLLGQLNSKLSALGYEGVGMEVETGEVIELLIKVFSDPSVANRKIKMVYTGAANDYDPVHESLTLGGSRDAKTLIGFIKKKVPSLKKRKGSPSVKDASPLD
jgi:hypothetical protein